MNGSLVALMLISFINIINSNVADMTHHDDLKTLARKVRQADDDEPPSVPVIVTDTSATHGNEPCTPDQCSNKGTCFGTKQMPFCFCQLGYAGTRCQDRYCDSNRDCNAHGLCMGTASQYTCICNLGFSGTRCELQSVASAAVVSTPTPFGFTTVPLRIAEDSEKVLEPSDEQI